MTVATWTWTGFQDVNVPTLAACLLAVAALLVLGVFWTRKPETGKRGVVTLAMILIPAVLSALVVGLRILAS